MESVSEDHAHSAEKCLKSEKVTAKHAKAHNACKTPETSARQKNKATYLQPYARAAAFIINTIFPPEVGSVTEYHASGANVIHNAP
jgi:hypothetical protein